MSDQGDQDQSFEMDELELDLSYADEGSEEEIRDSPEHGRERSKRNSPSKRPSRDGRVSRPYRGRGRGIRGARGRYFRRGYGRYPYDNRGSRRDDFRSYRRSRSRERRSRSKGRGEKRDRRVESHRMKEEVSPDTGSLRDGLQFEARKQSRRDDYMHETRKQTKGDDSNYHLRKKSSSAERSVSPVKKKTPVVRKQSSEQLKINKIKVASREVQKIKPSLDKELKTRELARTGTTRSKSIETARRSNSREFFRNRNSRSGSRKNDRSPAREDKGSVSRGRSPVKAGSRSRERVSTNWEKERSRSRNKRSRSRDRRSSSIEKLNRSRSGERRSRSRNIGKRSTSRGRRSRSRERRSRSRNKRSLSRGRRSRSRKRSISRDKRSRSRERRSRSRDRRMRSRSWSPRRSRSRGRRRSSYSSRSRSSSSDVIAYKPRIDLIDLEKYDEERKRIVGDGVYADRSSAPFSSLQQYHMGGSTSSGMVYNQSYLQAGHAPHTITPGSNPYSMAQLQVPPPSYHNPLPLQANTPHSTPQDVYMGGYQQNMTSTNSYMNCAEPTTQHYSQSENFSNRGWKTDNQPMKITASHSSSIVVHTEPQRAPLHQSVNKKLGVEEEMRNQKQTLVIQRDQYLQKNTALQRELVRLKEQRLQLQCQDSPETERLLKENAKLQNEIAQRLKAIENVIEMLSGLIKESPKAEIWSSNSTNQPSASSRPSTATSISSDLLNLSSARPPPRKKPEEKLKPTVVDEERDRDWSRDRSRPSPKRKELERGDEGADREQSSSLPLLLPKMTRERRPSPAKTKARDEQPPSTGDTRVNLVYYDPELHWCSLCNIFPKTVSEYLHHLHTSNHMAKITALKLDPSPWRTDLPPPTDLPPAPMPNAPTKRIPIRGVQFLVPSMGWYCRLCKMWIGDIQSAQDHLKGLKHTGNYAEYVQQNPHWEVDWLSDRTKSFERSSEQLSRLREKNDKGQTEQQGGISRPQIDSEQAKLSALSNTLLAVLASQTKRQRRSSSSSTSSSSSDKKKSKKKKSKKKKKKRDDSPRGKHSPDKGSDKNLGGPPSQHPLPKPKPQEDDSKTDIITDWMEPEKYKFSALDIKSRSRHDSDKSGQISKESSRRGDESRNHPRPDARRHVESSPVAKDRAKKKSSRKIEDIFQTDGKFDSSGRDDEAPMEIVSYLERKEKAKKDKPQGKLWFPSKESRSVEDDETPTAFEKRAEESASKKKVADSSKRTSASSISGGTASRSFGKPTFIGKMPILKKRTVEPKVEVEIAKEVIAKKVETTIQQIKKLKENISVEEKSKREETYIQNKVTEINLMEDMQHGEDDFAERDMDIAEDDREEELAVTRTGEDAEGKLHQDFRDALDLLFPEPESKAREEEEAVPDTTYGPAAPPPPYTVFSRETNVPPHPPPHLSMAPPQPIMIPQPMNVPPPPLLHPPGPPPTAPPPPVIYSPDQMDEGEEGSAPRRRNAPSQRMRRHLQKKRAEQALVELQPAPPPPPPPPVIPPVKSRYEGTDLQDLAMLGIDCDDSIVT